MEMARDDGLCEQQNCAVLGLDGDSVQNETAVLRCTNRIIRVLGVEVRGMKRYLLSRCRKDC
jgi:hypothetical protein